MNGQRTYSETELKYYVWAIAIALPNAQYRNIARFYNRQDAEDHLRVLQRFIPTAQFVICFDTPDLDLAESSIERSIIPSQTEAKNKRIDDRLKSTYTN